MRAPTRLPLPLPRAAAVPAAHRLLRPSLALAAAAARRPSSGAAAAARAALAAVAAAETSSPLDAALALEELDSDLYLQRLETLWTPAGSRAVFGGQIVGASLVAAERSRSNSAFQLHSLHSYFLRPGLSRGENARPILYQVTRLRDGTSFETRAVTARQNGQAIYTALLSFHKSEADRTGGVVGHAVRPPAVLPPEACAPVHVGATAFPIEVRPAQAAAGAAWPARRAAWFKCPPLPPPSPATAHLHRAALAFASDWGLGMACLIPYGIAWGDPRLTMAASLDHALFFHDSFDGAAPAPAAAGAGAGAAADARPLLTIQRHADTPRLPAASAPPPRADDWLLVEFDSPSMRSARGLNFSRMWTREGTLVLSAVQESLVRVAGQPQQQGGGST